MAIANSYSRVQGPAVGFFNGAQESYARVPGPAIALFGAAASAYARVLAVGDVDSSDTIVPRVENSVQRGGTNIEDVSGKIYNSNGGAVTLVDVEYSQVSDAGPWLPVTVLSGDGAYVFPSPGLPGGSPFNIPIEIAENYTGNIWVKVKINSAPWGDQEDVGGPFAFIFVNLFPDAASFITVPEESLTGDYRVAWGPAAKADTYDLEEATDAGFTDAVVVQSGTTLFFDVTGKDAGSYYYRVRGENVKGFGPYLDGDNPCEVLAPVAPTTISVPPESSTGAYRVSWTPSVSADFYELQEDTTNAFTNARVIYTGPNTVFDVLGKKNGRFYYRVRAGRN